MIPPKVNQVKGLKSFEKRWSNNENDATFRRAYWKGDREAEGARLEIVCTATYRGFESHPFRQNDAWLLSNCSNHYTFSLLIGRRFSGFNGFKKVYIFNQFRGNGCHIRGSETSPWLKRNTSAK